MFVIKKEEEKEWYAKILSVSIKNVAICGGKDVRQTVLFKTLVLRGEGGRKRARDRETHAERKRENFTDKARYSIVSKFIIAKATVCVSPP
jgi:hypothetical protein